MKIEKLPTAPSGKDLSSLYHKYPGGILPEDLKPYKVKYNTITQTSGITSLTQETINKNEI